MLKNKDSLLFKEYNAALLLYADMSAIRDEESILAVLEMLQQEAKEREEIEEKYERQEEVQPQKQFEEVYRVHLQEITDQHDVKYPELIPQFAQLAFHLDQLRSTEADLNLAQADQKALTQEWKTEQTDFAKNVIETMENETLTFGNDSTIPLPLTEQDKLEITMDFGSTIPPLQALEKNPHKMAQLEHERKEIIKLQGKDEATMTPAELIQVKQEAVEKTNINNQAALTMMLRIIPKLVQSLKNNLSDDEYNDIKWPYPKQLPHKNIDFLLSKQPFVKNLKDKIQGLNNRYIENEEKIAVLGKKQEENLDNVSDTLNIIYKALSKDTEMRDELSEIIGKLPEKPKPPTISPTLE